MTPATTYRHEFVDEVPDALCADVLYVSINYTTAAHRCFCGCGSEVVTPITPNDWKLSFDGESVSLSPSIGNWSYPCRSHYFLRSGRVQWAAAWSPAKVDAARAGTDHPAEAKIRARTDEAVSVLGRFRRWIRR